MSFNPRLTGVRFEPCYSLSFPIPYSSLLKKDVLLFTLYIYIYIFFIFKDGNIFSRESCPVPTHRLTLTDQLATRERKKVASWLHFFSSNCSTCNTRKWINVEDRAIHRSRRIQKPLIGRRHCNSRGKENIPPVPESTGGFYSLEPPVTDSCSITGIRTRGRIIFCCLIQKPVHFHFYF